MHWESMDFSGFHWILGWGWGSGAGWLAEPQHRINDAQD